MRFLPPPSSPSLACTVPTTADLIGADDPPPPLPREMSLIPLPDMADAASCRHQGSMECHDACHGI